MDNSKTNTIITSGQMLNSYLQLSNLWFNTAMKTSFFFYPGSLKKKPETTKLYSVK